MEAQKQQGQEEIEVSFVMPCLNEEGSVGICVEKACRVLSELGMSGEVIVADNGSTDASVEIARQKGGKVIHVANRGYGNALMGGIEAAKGRVIIMGDADNTYDFLEAPGLVVKLRDGYDLVIGSRFKGWILRGAMPWASRIGNPIMTGILNALFRVGISDSQSGFRAFVREAYERMQLQATGMEFASEMLIKAKMARLRIAEVPISLYPDRRSHPSHLRPAKDGWRHLKLMLTYSSSTLFFIPGIMLMLVGLLLMASQLFAPMDRPLWLFGRLRIDFHWAILGSLLALVGYQIMNTHFMAKIYSVTHRFQEQDRWLELSFRWLNAERVLVASLLVITIGLAINGWVLWEWLQRGYGPLVSGHTRAAIFGSTLLAFGVQTFFNAFFYSILGDAFKKTRQVNRSSN